MPSFPGAPTRSASAPGAPRLRRGHELSLLRAGFLRGRTQPDSRLDRATEPTSQTHAPFTHPVRASRLAQTQRRRQRHERPRRPVADGTRRPHRSAAVAARPRSPLRRLPKPSRPRSQLPTVSTKSVRCAPNPSATPARAVSGTPSSTAIITSALRPCPAHSCDTSSAPQRANRWPCSASAPPRGRLRHGTS